VGNADRVQTIPIHLPETIGTSLKSCLSWCH